MAMTHTISTTFTISHARYITSKVAADLRQLQLFYGRPSDQEISAYAEEAALLLKDGYLDHIDYGFKREDALSGSRWALLLRYTARNGVLADDHAGRVPADLDLAGAPFASYLIYSQAFLDLSESKRDEVEATLPIRRISGSESGFVAGTWSSDRTYSSADHGVARSVFRPL
jgi:hypothetical protein